MSDKKTTQQLTSADLVRELDDQTVLLVRSLYKKDILPHLAVVATGDTANSRFIKVKKQRGRALGIIVSVYQLPEKATAAEIKEVIDFLNQDPEIHGVIVQLPLSDHLNAREAQSVLDAIKPVKDVDGLGKGRLIPRAKGLAEMQAKVITAAKNLPTTAAAMLLLCEHYNLDLTDGVVIVGKGPLVGQPLKEMLAALSIKALQVDKADKELNKAIFKAKVILAGTNSPKAFLDDRFVQERAYVVAAGNEIDHKRLDGYAEGITPIKGGVGPLTVSLLLSNTVRACIKQNR